MTRSNTVSVTIVGDSDAAQKAFRNLDKAAAESETKMKRVGSGISNSAKAAFAIGGAGAIAMGADLYKLGANLEQMDAKAKTIFGDQIGNVQSWAKENANAMGLTAKEAVGLSANFADLLIPMGMSQAEAAKMSTEVIGLSGALSAWSGGQKSAADVAEILQGAMLGETDALKGLGISISAADIQQRLLKNGQNQLTGAAREQAEALAVQQLIMEKSTDAQRAFKDGVQSTNEKMAEQAARFRESKEALASSLTPAVNQAVIALNGFVVAGTKATETSGGLQGMAYKFGAAWADVNADIKETRGLLGALADKMQLLNKLNPTFQLGKAIGGLIPGRAAGGPVQAGRPYIVGETQPELFVPNVSGHIVPSIGNAGPGESSGGGNVVNVTIAGPMVGRDAADYFVRMLQEHLGRGGQITNGHGASVVLG